MESVIAFRREREKPQEAQEAQHILRLLCFLWFLPIFLSDPEFSGGGFWFDLFSCFLCDGRRQPEQAILEFSFDFLRVDFLGQVD